MAYGFKATANISPSRFVVITSGSPFEVTQASAATDRLFGISEKGTYYAPGTAADSGYAIPTGKVGRIHQEGEECLLKLGGTVAAGDLLTSDASGQGVAYTVSGTTKKGIGARALQDGVSGEFIRVVVKTFEAVTATV